MHARVTTVSVQPDKVAETTRVYNESILPAIKAAAGNRGALLLIDPVSGKGLFITITLWDSEAAGQAYDTSGTYREQVAKVAPFFSGPPSLETYEVGAQDKSAGLPWPGSNGDFLTRDTGRRWRRRQENGLALASVCASSILALFDPHQGSL